ncbi:MAG: ABC transporter permease [Bacteroidota bacterium]|nr:ABC transporter permease [Bacteroidota bacterium]
MYAFHLLTEHWLRYILTAFGISLCVLLIIFLLALYKGVSYGSVEYVRASQADLWVLQKHATNILRSTSLMPAYYGVALRKVKGVKSVSPVFFILASVRLNGTNATTYLTGFDLKTGIGGPPRLIEGRTVTSINEIVIDKAFAAKHHLKTGDKIQIKDDSLTITGISTGTNMFVIQYAFISLEEAYFIIGFPGVVSCFQVNIQPGFKLGNVQASIQSKLKKVVSFDKETFVKNNIQEMDSGIIPLLFIVTFISAIVLTAILSLILSINVLEKRKDFAILKVLGSPRGFISGIVIEQSILLSLTGFVFAVILYFPMISLIEKITPEVSVMTTLSQLIIVLAGVNIISLASTILPNRRIRQIYPLEVFL